MALPRTTSTQPKANPNQTQEITMSNAASTVKAFVAAVFDANGTNIDRIDEFFHPDCVFHDAMPGLEGVEGYKNQMRMFESATNTVEGAIQPIVIGDGEFCGIRWINQLEQKDEIFGVPNSGKRFLAKGHEFYRVEGGKIVENWGIYDIAGMLAQLDGA
jgi:predicted ester cyclase